MPYYRDDLQDLIDRNIAHTIGNDAMKDFAAEMLRLSDHLQWIQDNSTEPAVQARARDNKIEATRP